MEESDRPVEIRADTEKDHTEKVGAHCPPENRRVSSQLPSWRWKADLVHGRRLRNMELKASLSAGLGKLTRSW